MIENIGSKMSCKIKSEQLEPCQSGVTASLSWVLVISLHFLWVGNKAYRVCRLTWSINLPAVNTLAPTFFPLISDRQRSARVPEAGPWSQAVLQPLQAGQEAQQTDPVCRGTHPGAEVGVCVCVQVNVCLCKIHNNIPLWIPGIASSVTVP